MKVGSKFLDRQLGEYSLLQVYQLYDEQELKNAFIKGWKKYNPNRTFPNKYDNILQKIFVTIKSRVNDLSTNKYNFLIVEHIQNALYEGIYSIYQPQEYIRRYDLYNNIRAEVVYVNGLGYGSCYYVVEIDAPFNKSLIGSETLTSGLPAMIDEKGIPPLPFLPSTTEQPWTEPRPFWNQLIEELKSNAFLGLS